MNLARIVALIVLLACTSSAMGGPIKQKLKFKPAKPPKAQRMEAKGKLKPVKQHNHSLFHHKK